jgi:glycerophosphoryl diester phosphodiesterase
VLERFRDRVAFGIELKAGSDFYPGIEERLLSLVQLYDVADRTLVASFDHHALRTCRRLDPDVRTGALVVGRLLAPAALAPPGVLHALCLQADLTTAREVAAVREAGLDCYVWVVNDPVIAARFAGYGVTGIVTDRPDLIMPALDTASRGPAS